jgi:GT2 family glycosyltransferase
MASPAGPEQPLVSIIIPAWNKWDYTFRCLASLVEHTSGVAHETIVVDNASTDETATALPRLPGLRVHRNDRNLGFAKACNQGAGLARGRHLLFLNNDTEALANWLPPLVRMLESAPDIAMVGSKLLFPDGTIQHAGVVVAYGRPLPISPFHAYYRKPPAASARPLEVSAVTAACMLVRADAFSRLGGFDEGYRNGYEDVDLCFKVRAAGLRIAYTPESVLYHHESVSEGRFLNNAENEDLLNRRWMGRFTEFDIDRRRARPTRPPAEARPPVSVVVPTHDSLHFIAPCLEDLADQLGPADEIVVADAGSRDCTLQFVEQFSREHPGLVRVLAGPPGGGPPEAARAGLEAARDGICLLVHPSLRMEPDFTAAITTALGRLGRQALLCSPIKGAGFCAAGPSGILRALAAKAPGALFQESAGELEAGVRRSGPARLLIVSPPG